MKKKNIFKMLASIVSVLLLLSGCTAEVPQQETGGTTTVSSITTTVATAVPTTTTTEVATTTTATTTMPTTVRTTVFMSESNAFDVLPREGGVLAGSEKLALNKLIEDTLLRPMWRLVGQWEFENLEGTIEIIDEAGERAEFAWEVMLQSGAPRIRDIDEQGRDVTGGCAVKPQYYEDAYQRVFDEPADISVLCQRMHYVEQDGYIYGGYITGGTPDFALKAHSFEITSENVVLSMDMISMLEYELWEYNDPSMIDYTEDLIYSTAVLTLREKDSRYVLESLQITKK